MSVSADAMVMTVRSATTVVETEVLQSHRSCMVAVGHQCSDASVIVVPPSDILAVAPGFEGDCECLVLLRMARLAANSVAAVATAAFAYQLVVWAAVVVVLSWELCVVFSAGAYTLSLWSMSGVYYTGNPFSGVDYTKLVRCI